MSVEVDMMMMISCCDQLLSVKRINSLGVLGKVLYI